MVRLGRIKMEERIMKKIFVIMCAFAAAFGCQKAEMEQPQESEGVKVPLQVTASIAQTKTTMTNEDGVLKSAWKDGDKIYLQKFEHQTYTRDNNLEYTASVSGNSVSFDTETEGVVIPTANPSYYTILAEYPKALKSYGTAREFSMSADQTQAAAGDLAHIAASNMMYAWGTPAWESDPVTVNFDFKHALSVLQLNLKGAEPGIVITKIEVEMLDETGADWLVITKGQLDARYNGTIKQLAGENKMNLYIASASELPTDGYAQFYMTVSPGHAGQTFKVTATTDMGKIIEVGSMKVPAEGAIPQGAKAMKSFTVNPPVKEDVDYASAIDLSADGTANTYLVTKANTLYKFKADVKGNGFVPEALKAVGVGAVTEISPKTALLLWYNCVQTSKAWVEMEPVDISSIVLKDGYIYFKTPETFVNGNAVIAAFAEAGLTYANITADENRLLTNATILWSWNIWAAEGYDIEADAFTAGEFTIMGRNIGAAVGKAEIDSYQTAAERKYVAASAIGNYYQWGNKNPYPHVSDYENYAIPKYGNKLHNTPTYTPITALQVGTNANEAMAKQMFGTADQLTLDFGTYMSSDDRTPANIVSYTESAPYKYMKDSTSGYGYSWTGHIGGTALEALWGDATLEDVSDHVKTIYGPCPGGWKVWEDDAWDAMVTAGAETAVIDMNAMDAGKGGYGSIICGSYFPSNGGGRGPGFNVEKLTRCAYAVETAYFVSNLNIYSSKYWGKKYLIQHAGNFTQETDIELLIGNHLCTGYSTPLRCVKE
jgi:hypothetical protein